jgi:hypothetical protein
MACEMRRQGGALRLAAAVVVDAKGRTRLFHERLRRIGECR